MPARRGLGVLAGGRVHRLLGGGGGGLQRHGPRGQDLLVVPLGPLAEMSHLRFPHQPVIY